MVMTRCQELVFLSGTGDSEREERRWDNHRSERQSTSKTDENAQRVRQKDGAERLPSYC